MSIKALSGRTRRTILARAAGWIIIGAAATGVVACTSAAAGTSVQSSAEADTDSADADTAISTESGTATDGGGFADGTYTATGSYRTPGGTEAITVTLAIADGVVTAVTAEGGATSPPSSQFQDAFEQAVSAAVVGQGLDGLELDALAGSSLTPAGFNDALDQIRSDALA